MLVRRFLLGALTLVIAGCTGQPPPPSTPAERAANPESITRDNPGGDALNPTDAALERLLNAKLGRKIDKFETVEPAFSDWKNWKRVRYFGYPTRAGFRYGKDPAYAAAVLIYEESEDDSPMTCIERFAGKAETVAGLFDLELGPVEREMRTHRAGVEAVDWEAWEVDWKEREEERVDKLKKRLARQEELKKKRKLMRFKSPRLAHASQQALKDRLPPPKAMTPKDPAAKSDEDTATPPTPPAKEETAEQKAKREAAKRKAEIIRAGFLRRAKLAAERRKARLAKMTPEERAKMAQRRKEFEKRRAERLEKMKKVRPTPFPKNLEPGDMPLIVTSGKFRTLFNRDRYLAGIVAYDSWPGTCLVQGFAVKVGSDEELAEKVLWRWIEEMAPILRWKRELREAPEIKNR